MKCLFLILFSFSFSVHSFNKDFNLVNDRAPLEFRLLFESMKYSLKELNEQVRLIVLAQHINKGLGPLKKDQSFFLLKSEVYKSLLEWPHPPTQFQVGSHTLERIKTNINASKAIYTPFSQWVLEALMADLEEFQKEGLLDLPPAQKSMLNGEKSQRYLKMQRVLKYTRGWLEQADTMSAKDFNKLTEELSWKTLERVKERSSLFRRFSSKAVQDSNQNTFNIPEQGMPQMNQGKPAPPATTVDPAMKGISEKAAEEKAEASSSVENLEVDSAAVPAQELSEAIDKIEEPGTAETPAVQVEEELK